MRVFLLMNSCHAINKLRCMAELFQYFLILTLLVTFVICFENEEKCEFSNLKNDKTGSCESNKPQKSKWTEKSNRRYILYDVNPGEGFNLRRDVYMRVAGLVRKLIRQSPTIQWVLVLPPWGPLYHWQSKNCGSQTNIQWSEFFDLESLGYYVPIVEFFEYLEQYGPVIDMVYYLQHSDWNESTLWVDKISVEDCKEPTKYSKMNSVYIGRFWGYNEVQVSNFHCLTVQGSASLLKPVIENNTGSVLIDRAEIVLHDSFGDSDYWAARRSMRFSKKLRLIADKFRKDILNSNDIDDKTVSKDDWREMKVSHGSAKGGPYIAVHLRRKDFVQSRKNDVPNLEYAAKQIKVLQQTLGIEKVFIATDALLEEFYQLQNYLPGAIRYDAPEDVLLEVKDGGIAIIDQWICTHAEYFIGTFESTFSFRIQEEREILGFKPTTTFNRLCGNKQKSCQQPSKWNIVY